jgi:hypothetical protein
MLLSPGMVFGENVAVSTSNERLQRIFDEVVRANLKNVERMKDGRKQAWQGNEYRLVNSGGGVAGFTNGKKTFDVPNGLRVETDYAGNVSKIAGLSPVRVTETLVLGKLTIKSFAAEPNQVYSGKNGILRKNADQ